MAINLGSAVGYLLLDTSGFTGGLRKANSAFNTFLDSSKKANTRLSALGTAFTSAGATLTKNVTLPLAGLGVAAAKAAVDFESAFTGVVKTVDGTDEELNKLRDDIIEMSNTMPQSANQIAEVAAAAGQLGIKTEDIAEFTRVMLMLGDATNLTSTDAATQLARLANITGMTADKYGALGSAIVDLGNNFATTESEIVSMSMRLAAAGTNAGLAETDILALSTAMSSVGIRAEAGGSAMSTFLSNLQVMVETGSKDLENFAAVANMSADEFATAFQEDAAGALVSFLAGLQDTERNGASAIAVLDALGISEIRQRNTLLSLSNAHGMLSDALGLSKQAWNDELALSKEAETRYATTASQLSILKNKIKNLAISFGELLLPTIQKVVDVLQRLADKLNSMDEGKKKTIVTIAAIAAAIGPVLIILGKLIFAVGMVVKLFSAFGGAATLLTGPIGIIIAAVGALVAAWVTDFEGMREKTHEIFESIGTIISSIWGWIKGLWDSNFLGIQETTRNAWEIIKGVFSTALNFLADLFAVFADIFTGDWTALGEDLTSLIKGVLIGISDFIMSVLEAIVTAIFTIGSQLWEAGSYAFNQLWEGIKSIMSPITDWISEAWENIKQLIKDYAPGLYEAGSTIFNSLFSGLKSVWDAIAGWVSEKVEWIKNKLSGAVAEVSGYGSSTGNFATGIDYIPSDRIVKVHEGEAILSKEQNARRRSSDGDTFNFYSPKALTETKAARAMKKAKQQLAAGVV